MRDGTGPPPHPRDSPELASAWAVDGARNLEIDEALLHAGVRSVRAGFLSSPSLSLGVAQADDAPAGRRARRLGIPVLRRRSGGTGVFHGAGDIVWSIVVPRTDPIAGRDFVLAYDRLGGGVVRWLADLGIQAAWSGPLGLSDEFCLLGARGKVLMAGGRVIGGAAQHVTSRALLHQGTVGYRVDRQLLSTLFDIERAVLDTSVTSLSEQGAVGATGALAAALPEHLRRSLDDPRGP